jgi:uncharacterized protein (DUF3084 family)
MAQKGPPLQKLVALKRQRAEQNLLSVQQELTALKTDLQRLETDLTSLNGEAGGIEAHILSYEHGYAQRQTLAIQACPGKDNREGSRVRRGPGSAETGFRFRTAPAPGVRPVLIGMLDL